MPLELYPYQEEAVNKLHTGSILCGGVGSGKSRTSIAYYFCKVCGGMIDGLKHDKESNYIPMKNPLDLYIITTARKRDTKEWEGELAPFLISKDPKSTPYDISVSIDSWNNIGKYTEAKNAFFIFDEQRVVGYGSWVKAFLKIAKKNQWILLSATPGDTWTDYIPVFIANGFYKNKAEFNREHVVYNHFTKFPKIDHFVNTNQLARYRNQILVTMDYERHTVYHEERLIVDYDKTEFKDLMSRRWNKEKDIPIENASELCYLLRKISNSHSSRSNTVLELCNKHPKVIIFYNFDYELEILKNLKYAKGTKVSEWNGHKHEPIPKSDRWVYLVNYAAGSEGWNCIETDTIIFFSQSYSYKTMIQARGRIDRLNTPFTDLYYYHIRSNSPIDIGISRALNRKKNFNESSFLGR